MRSIYIVLVLMSMLFLSGCIVFNSPPPETKEELTVTVEGGYLIEGSDSSTLYLSLNEPVQNEQIARAELPLLLRDGSLEDDDGDGNFNDDVDYTQTIVLSNFAVKYGTPEQVDDPIYYLSTDESGDDITYTIDFEDTVSMSGYTDSENILMLDKTFTIGSETTSSELVLFAADASTYLELNQTIVYEGEYSNFYNVTIVDYSSEADGGNGNIVLSVNGVRRTLEEGDSVVIAELPIYVQDLFVTDIPTVSASANLFLGAQQINLFGGQVQVNDADLEGVTYSIVGADFDSLDQLSFHVDFGRLDEDNGYDEDEDTFLREGEAIELPLFNTAKVFFPGSFDEPKEKFFAFVGYSDAIVRIE